MREIAKVGRCLQTLQESNSKKDLWQKVTSVLAVFNYIASFLC